MWSRVARYAGIAYVILALSPLVGVAFWYVGEAASSFFAGRPPDWYGRQAMTAPERAKDLAGKGLLEQVITIRDTPLGLRKDPKTDEFDLYAIGVGQTTLPEEQPAKTYGLVGDDQRFASRYSGYASSSALIGQYNNVILFEPKSGKLTKMFSERVAVSSFKYERGPDFEVVIALVAEADTNKDGRLSEADIQSVYVYSLRDGSMRKVINLTGSAVEIARVPLQQFAIVRAVVDHNRDGRAVENPYDSDAPEPSVLLRLDLVTLAVAPLLPGDMIKDLQTTLDARASSNGAPKP